MRGRSLIQHSCPPRPAVSQVQSICLAKSRCDSEVNWSRLTASLMRFPDKISSWRSWCGSSSLPEPSSPFRFHAEKWSHS
ncbi:Uncharacterized protein DAT39_004531 [Clarias magur]|uniref:Uncharacterized protein n=1 Tax=Clarias magur TaxID=1594786 RepID=A0A8J4URW1_CLAMG|nr:Uncharacterized protein DAT39_004531 [Clarias magur]